MNYDIKCSKCHRWLAHIPAVIRGSLSQRCQWLSPVMQTKLTVVHCKTWELVLASVAAFVKIPAMPLNLIIQWIEVG